MLLYHFTCLYHLPNIMREGINQGEVFISPREILQAPNLTTNSNPQSLLRAANISGATDKTKVRVAVSIPDGDPLLEEWLVMCRRRHVDKVYRKRLDLIGQGKFWYVYWGVIPVDWFTEVGILQSDSYSLYKDEALVALIRDIETEREGIPMRGQKIDPPPGRENSWLLDGPDIPLAGGNQNATECFVSPD